METIEDKMCHLNEHMVYNMLTQGTCPCPQWLLLLLLLLLSALFPHISTLQSLKYPATS